jgi:hypothetical protein
MSPPHRSDGRAQPGSRAGLPTRPDAVQAGPLPSRLSPQLRACLHRLRTLRGAFNDRALALAGVFEERSAQRHLDGLDE